MNTADLADLAHDSLRRLRDDLRASRGTAADLRTLRDDRVQARGDLERLAAAYRAEGEQSRAVYADAHASALGRDDAAHLPADYVAALVDGYARQAAA